MPTGVTKHGKCYRANIKVNGKGFYLGMFRTPTEAHKRYMDALTAKQSGNWQEWYENNYPQKERQLPKGVTKRDKRYRVSIQG